jgi:hypothetical protein
MSQKDNIMSAFNQVEVKKEEVVPSFNLFSLMSQKDNLIAATLKAKETNFFSK